MLDAKIRPYIDPPLNQIAATFVTLGISANQTTIAGFLVGIAAFPLVATQHYVFALTCILLNRLLDGLDGAVARKTEATDVGGYLDIVLDFIFYSAVIMGFALARPENAPYAAFLIFSFIGTGSSFLAYSVFAAKRHLTTDVRGKKSFYHLGGLTEGTETIAVFVLICLLPDAFSEIALIFGALCWITTASRIAWACQTLRE